jgi:hypothetical protein
MRPYLDAGFLLTLLINTEGSATAKAVLENCRPPYSISLLHQLQAENLLAQLVKSEHAARQRAGKTGLRLWAWYFAEGLLELGDADWAAAFRLAITWNAEAQAPPPLPLLLLHPAAAVISEATHFLSFDPRSRVVGQRAGLTLLPEVL